MFPWLSIWPLPTVRWVYTFPGSLHLPRRQTRGSSFVDYLDVPWVGFVLGSMRIDLTFSPFLSWLLCWPWILIPVGYFLGLVLFPQLQVGVPPGFFLKGFAFGLGLVPQSVITSARSFVDYLDVPWVGFVLGSMRIDLTFSPFLNWLWWWPWILIPVESFLGLVLFPQLRVRVPPRSFLKGFASGLGLVPQSVVTSAPSFLGSFYQAYERYRLLISESLS